MASSQIYKMISKPCGTIVSTASKIRKRGLTDGLNNMRAEARRSMLRVNITLT